MATWIIGLIVICAVYLALKHVLRAQKSGGCIGCDSCGKGGCSHCTEIKAPKLTGKHNCCEK